MITVAICASALALSTSSNRVGLAQPQRTMLVSGDSQVGRRAAILSAAAAAAVIVPSVHADDGSAKAREQMAASAKALDELLNQFDSVVSADGGNGIRRVLGKLGPTSPLYRVDKALNVVARDLEDERSFDLVDEFLRELDSADGDAYSSIFVPTGGGTTPEYWLARSKKDVVRARTTLGRILELQ